MKTKKIYSIYAVYSVLFVSLLTGCTLKDMETEYKAYAIAVSGSVGGTVSGSNSSIAYNSNITVTATPNVNYSFSGWYEDSLKVNSDSIYTFTVKGNRSLEAHFKDVQTFSVGVKLVNDDFTDVTEYGSVTGAGDYMNNTEATLVATPNLHYNFWGWYATDMDFNSQISTDPTLKLTAAKDTTLYAMFQADMFNISLTAVPTDGGKVSPDIAGSWPSYYNSNTSLSATANSGYRFAGFYNKAGKLLSTANPFFLLVTQDSSIEARFVKTWTVNVSDDGFGTASINAGGTSLVVDDGTSVTLNAKPTSADYYFAGWTNGSDHVSPNNPYTITVTGNVNLKATFTTDPKGTGTTTDWTNNPIETGTAN